MPVQYSAGPRVSATTICATKTDVLNMMEAQLVLAGWSVISGSGTTNRLFQSGTTSQGLALRARVKDNGGTCVQFSIESTDGTKVGTNSTLGGGSITPIDTYRVIANPFQFMVYAPANYALNRKFVMVCCPYIPAPNAVPTRAGFLICDSQADANATLFHCWRTTMLVGSTQPGAAPNCQMLWANSIWETVNASITQWQALVQAVCLMSCNGSGGVTGGPTTPLLYQWENLANMTSDAFVGWATSQLTDPILLRAQLWDALFVFGAYPGDTTGVWDGHNWITPTNNNTGGILNSSVNPRCSVFVTTS